MGKTEYIITIAVFNLFFLLFIAAIVVYIRQYQIKKNEHHVLLDRQKSEYQKEMLANELEMQQQTMQHIGREIHDNIGQKLTLASLYTQQLAYENKVPQINANIENISAILNDSLSDLRQLSKSLTDSSIENKTLKQLLQNECEKIKKLRKCKVDFTFQTDDTAIPYQEKCVLFRIAQEFLQNSIKHSDCKNILVGGNIANQKLNLSLCDDGKGFDSTKPKYSGIGIGNMKKRAEIIGADLKLQSTDTGTALTIEITLA